MSLRLFVLIIITASCSKPSERKNTTKDSTINLDLNKGISLIEQVFKLDELKDTTLNGVILDFTELPETRYDSLRQLVRESFIPLQFNTDKILRMDSCLLVKLDNENWDTLCNKRQGDYFEQYTFKGIWNEIGLVLITYQDWEGGNDFFINLKDGGYYYLTHNYKLSPDFKHILSFST